MRRLLLISSFVFLLVILFFPQSSSADLEFNPGSTPADSQRLKDLIVKCEGELQSFRELMDAIRRSTRPVPVFPGRDQPGVYVDAFNTGEIDLSDLEKYANPRKDRETGKYVFPPGSDPEAATLCQNLAHILYERFHANYVGGRFEPSHEAANGYESRIRREFGQTGSLVDLTGDGAGNSIWIYINSTFIIQRDTITTGPGGSQDIGPITTTPVKVVCVGVCQGQPGRRVIAGSDTCANCESDLMNQCGGTPLLGSTCRTK